MVMGGAPSYWSAEPLAAAARFGKLRKNVGNAANFKINVTRLRERTFKMRVSRDGGHGMPFALTEGLFQATP
jgi:hypothetical protein